MYSLHLDTSVTAISVFVCVCVCVCVCVGSVLLRRVTTWMIWTFSGQFCLKPISLPTFEWPKVHTHPPTHGHTHSNTHTHTQTRWQFTAGSIDINLPPPPPPGDSPFFSLSSETSHAGTAKKAGSCKRCSSSYVTGRSRPAFAKKLHNGVSCCCKSLPKKSPRNLRGGRTLCNNGSKSRVKKWELCSCTQKIIGITKTNISQCVLLYSRGFSCSRFQAFFYTYSTIQLNRTLLARNG